MEWLFDLMSGVRFRSVTKKRELNVWIRLGQEVVEIRCD